MGIFFFSPITHLESHFIFACFILLMVSLCSSVICQVQNLTSPHSKVYMIGNKGNKISREMFAMRLRRGVSTCCWKMKTIEERVSRKQCRLLSGMALLINI